MEQTYIYGIVQASEELVLEARGLGGAPVYGVACGDVGCFLSRHSGTDPKSLPREAVIRSLFTHQAVVEKIMEKYAVLPVKFGTILPGDDQALDLLSQGRQRLAEALAGFHGKVEIEVAATWDTGQVLAELAGQEDIARARASILAMPPGETVLHQVRLGQMVKEALDRRRTVFRQRMLEFLKPLVLDVQPNVLVSDQMVMNVAFLLARDRQAEFDARVRDLNDEFGDRVNFRVVGPLPPYSFATVEVARPDWDKVQAARALLGLGERISETQVKKAYRRLAVDTHPDVNPVSGAASGYLGSLREASETLLGCCRGLPRTGGSPEVLRLDKETVERSFFISINRTESGEVEESRFGGAVSGTAHVGAYVSAG